MADNTPRERYKISKKQLTELTMMDDFMAQSMLANKELAELVLQIILDKPDLIVMESSIQQRYNNLNGRSCILDCVATDAAGTIYNIEIQHGSSGASPKRARYYSGIIDANALKTGTDYDQLPETYVIFIVDDDVLAGGLPIYHVERTIKENGNVFPDRTHIIYVNQSIQDIDTALGRLMHDFSCRQPGEMYLKPMAAQMDALKQGKEGADGMGQLSEMIYDEGVKAGVKKGMEAGKKAGVREGATYNARANAISFYQMGLPIEQIAKGIKFPVEQVKAWIAESEAQNPTE